MAQRNDDDSYKFKIIMMISPFFLFGKLSLDDDCDKQRIQRRKTNQIKSMPVS